MKTTILSALFLSLLTLTDSAGLSRRPAVAPTVLPAQLAMYQENVELHSVRVAKAGRLWEVYVKNGDTVRKGQLLAKVAIPLHSLEKQQREAQFHNLKQRYSFLVEQNAPAAALAQARQALVEAGHQVASAPKLYSFEFITATTSGTVQGRSVQPGQYLTDSSTVAVIANPVAPQMPPSLARN